MALNFYLGLSPVGRGRGEAAGREGSISKGVT